MRSNPAEFLGALDYFRTDPVNVEALNRSHTSRDSLYK